MGFSIFNLASVSVLENLTKISTQLAISNERLATAKRVNQASDDPSGIVAISNYNRQIAEIDASTANGQKISNLIDTADGGLGEIATLLDTIDAKLITAADTSTTSTERAAIQLEIDTAIAAINTLVNDTNFNGKRLLDGTIGFNASGVDATKIHDVRINSADNSGGAISLTVAVTAIAEKATFTYDGGTLGQNTDFTLTGTLGSNDFSFNNGDNVNTIVSAVNAVSDQTGIDAVNSGGNIIFTSQQYGDSETISVNVTTGAFALQGGITTDTGVDPTVTVNGQTAVSSGFQIDFNSGSTSLRFNVDQTFGTVVGSTTFSIAAGGGAQFQLNASASSRLFIGVNSLSSAYLGNNTVGILNTLKTGGTNDIASTNYNQAGLVVDAASGQVALERARLGAVKNYSVDATLASLAETRAALSTGVSQIEDLDVVKEVANNTRLKALLEVNTAIITAMNTSAGNILALITRNL